MEFTIAKAIAEYRANRRRAGGIGQLADFLMKHKIVLPEPFPNCDYQDALELTEVMLRHTQRQFVIVTGGASEGGFYVTLWEHLADALGRIRDVGGKGKMIVLSDQYPEWLKALAEDYRGTLEVATTAPRPSQKHFIVCDTKMVREEKLHGALTLNSRADQIKAEVYPDAPTKGKELEDVFESIWSAPETNKSIPQRRTQAPSWLVYQMEASRHLPSPTSAKVEKQFRSVEEARETCAVNSKS
jgi:hypothetical protein